MDCRKVERLLSDYLNNSLKDRYMDKIKQHLAQCERCTDTFNAMKKIDNLLKLKIKEKPHKEYWQNYWTKLEDRLDNNTTPQQVKNTRLLNPPLPKFSPAFSGILIALLILVNSLLYVKIQQITSLQSALNKQQEQMQKEISRYLTKSKGEAILLNFK